MEDGGNILAVGHHGTVTITQFMTPCQRFIYFNSIAKKKKKKNWKGKEKKQ